MVIRYTEPYDLEISAPAAELARLAADIERLGEGEELARPASRDAQPYPYRELLRGLRIRSASGPTRVHVEGGFLVIEGGADTLEAFASFLILEPGSHSHYEYFEGDLFVAPESLPLVISATDGDEEGTRG